MSTHQVGGWEGYWRSTREAAAHRDGGPQDQVLARFWTQFFEQTLPTYPRPRVLDVACGNGIVTGYAADVGRRLEGADLAQFGIDRSPAALRDLHKRFPDCVGVVAHALQSPFRDRSFDLIVSQFGVEYAGPAAVAEAARLVAPNGAFAAVVHLRDGAIYRECATNLRAVEAVRDSNLLACARQVFKSGIAVNRGRGSKAAFQRADANFAPAVASVEDVLRNHGKTVAGGVLYRLYSDIGSIYRRLDAYESGPVMQWLDRMAAEVDDYAQRMSAMLEAAADESTQGQMMASLGAQGLTVRIQELLHVGANAEPFAWALVGDRRA